jgi:hypothetical protein
MAYAMNRRPPTTKRTAASCGLSQAYFASTPEGAEEGRWLNEPTWMWIKAGSPTKIHVGGHPLRKVTFAKFEAQWREGAATGTPMTMVAPVKPKFRFGSRIG